MTITTKENANGRISAYFVDGVKVRKNEIDILIYEAARAGKIIEVDYHTGQQFKALTRSCYKNMKVVFTGETYGYTLMTEAAAVELGTKIIKRFSGAYYGLNVCEVEMPTATDAMLEAVVSPEAHDVAIISEIEAAYNSAVKNQSIEGSDLEDKAEIIAAGQKTVADYIKACDEENAKKYEAEIQKWFAMSTPQVTPEAQDAAIEAELEAAYNSFVQNQSIEGSDLEDKEREDCRAAGYNFILTVSYLCGCNTTEIAFTDAPVKTFESALRRLEIRIRCRYNRAWAIKDIDGNILVKGNNATDFFKFLATETDGSEDDPDEELISPNHEITTEEITIGEEILELHNGNIDNTNAPSDDFAAQLATLKNAWLNSKIESQKADDAVEAARRIQDAAINAEHTAYIAYAELVYGKAQTLRDALLDESIFLAKNFTVINQNGETLSSELSQIWIDFNITDAAFRIRAKFDFFANYKTPAQVELAINLLKAAIARGDKSFTFPTIDELNHYHAVEKINTPKAIEEKNSIADSLARAMKFSLEKVQEHCRAKDLTAANHEMQLYNICSNALRESSEPEKTVEQLNSTAPVGWKVKVAPVEDNSDKYNFQVEYKGKLVTTLDSLALQNFLTPEQFFEQFTPLIDNDFKRQFLADRYLELKNLEEMRQDLPPDSREKIDALIEQIKRDILQAELNEEEA